MPSHCLALGKVLHIDQTRVLLDRVASQVVPIFLTPLLPDPVVLDPIELPRIEVRLVGYWVVSDTLAGPSRTGITATQLAVWIHADRVNTSNCLVGRAACLTSTHVRRGLSTTSSPHSNDYPQHVLFYFLTAMHIKQPQYLISIFFCMRNSG